MTLRRRVSSPTWCPEHGRMSGSGLRDMGGMCLKSDLTKSIGKLCDSLIGRSGGNDHGRFRSHFGVQAFEKQSGRPDLNRRPLDPQESIHIPATRELPCFRS